MKYIFILLILFFNLSTSAQSRSEIISFSPEGTVKNVKQIKILFGSPMVPFGDPRTSTDQFDIDCPAKGKARWVDEKTYLYEFDKELEGGISCTFTLKSGIKNLSGKELTGKKQFNFNTGGPSILSSNPYEGAYIDEDQYFFIVPDANVKEDQISSLVYFSVEGIRDRVGVTPVSRDEVKESIFQAYGKEVPERLIIIKAKQRFPSKAKVTLSWPKGISSKYGINTEADQNLAFTVREPFTASFNCERENKNSACIPVTDMYLYFTEMVSKDQAKKIKLTDGKKTWNASFKGSEDEEDTDSSVRRVLFKGPFPEEAKFTISVPDGLKDDSGRKLNNQKNFPLTVSTAKFPPLAKFSGTFGVIELDGEPSLPVTLRNIEKDVRVRTVQLSKDADGIINALFGKKIKITPETVLYWLKKVGNTPREQSIFDKEANISTFNLPKPNGANAFEVVGIPIKEPGFYAVEIESKILGNSLLETKGSMFVPTSALVTNMSVHLKRGVESSLVWVTQLNNAKPVSDASVIVRDCKNVILAQGKTDPNGVVRLPGLKGKNIAHCSWKNYENGILVTAEKGNDLSFVHSSWDNGIEMWRFNLPTSERKDQIIAHSVLDRSLYRAGDVLSAKHFIRKHYLKGITLPVGQFPVKATITHLGSEQEYNFPLKWEGDGYSETVWKIPKEAKLGSYQIRLEKDNKESLYTSEFRVEEFRVPLLKATLQPPVEKLVKPALFNMDIVVKYLSGGGASNLPVRFKAFAREYGNVSFKEFEDFGFGSEDLKEGKRKLYDPYSEETEGNGTSKAILDKEFSLDKNGSGQIAVENLKKQSKPYNILTELEYRDPNGEIQTIARDVTIFPASTFVGLRNDSWMLSKDSVKVIAAVVDINGKPQAGKEVSIDIFVRKIITSRKRLVGGFYSYSSMEEVKKVGNFCKGKSDGKGIMVCEKGVSVSGNIVLQAKVTDQSGNESFSRRDVWIAGSESYWFSATDNDRMDVISERKNFESGEFAKFQIRAPFKNFTALVTVEREGVMEYFLKYYTSQNPTLEIPIKPEYSPNVYISVLAVRGRVGEIKPTALIDLGRPSYRLGISQINVGWKPHQLKVEVNADKEVYKVREKAKVKIIIKTADGKPLPEGGIAIAAVDEGLLELRPNYTWNLLEAMMRARSLLVETATAQMQVMGRRHYGLKALPQGGGGGEMNTRELFDTLLLWKTSLKFDKNGIAEIIIPLNDSLTKFKIVAIASAGTNYFGTGSTSIRSSQDLMLLAGVPPVAREGDEFSPDFTVRNSSSKSMEVEVGGKVSAGIGDMQTQTLTLEPGESKEVSWRVRIPVNYESVTYEFYAKAKNNTASDKIKITQKIVPSLPVNVIQASLFQLEGESEIPIEKPSDAEEGKGGVRVVYKKSLMESLDRVKEYMKLYPYSCIEQQASKAVSLRNKDRWNESMQKLPAYLDSDGLVKYFPISILSGSPTLTSYLLAISDESGYEIPKDVKERMISGLVGFVTGSIVRDSSLPTADLTIRKLDALESLSRFGSAKPDMMATLQINANLLPTSSVLDLWNILMRMNDAPNRAKLLNESEQILKGRMNLQGTTMNFTTDRSDGLWWLMVSSDTNAVKLLLTLVKQKKWKEDIGRIVRGVVGRQKKGSWDLTTANAWGVLAMEKFSKEYEKIPVSGSSTTTLVDQNKSIDWNESKNGGLQLFNWPNGKQNLKVSHNGTGKPWVTIQSLAALPPKESIRSGFSIEKTTKYVEKKNFFKVTRGDIMKVTLKLKADSDMTWVVINDPVPTGASILTGGLRSSTATEGEKTTGYVWPVFEERAFDAYRIYYEYVPQGEWTIEYTIRFNQDGIFKLPATRIEAMYSPEMFGECPNEAYEVIK